MTKNDFVKFLEAEKTKYNELYNGLMEFVTHNGRISKMQKEQIKQFEIIGGYLGWLIKEVEKIEEN